MQSKTLTSGSTWFCVEEWLDVLRCPTDGELFTVKNSESNSDWPKGTPLLTCNACSNTFPVINGIVRILGDQAGTQLNHKFKSQESVARDAAADDYEKGQGRFRDELEILPCLSALDVCESDVVVELGCGTGRLTRRVAPLVNRLVSIDFSLKSLQLLQERLPETVRRKTLLIHGDICVPPLANRVFSKALSIAVIEHVPTPAMRQMAIQTASRLLKPSGRFVCTVYNWSWRKQRAAILGIGDNSQKEGMHDSGIYYYNFVAEEIPTLFESSGFSLDFVQGLIISVRGARLLGRLIVPLNRALARCRYGLKHGEYLLVRAHSK